MTTGGSKEDRVEVGLFVARERVATLLLSADVYAELFGCGQPEAPARLTGRSGDAS